MRLARLCSARLERLAGSVRRVGLRRPRVTRNTSGSVAIEAALILPMFFLLAFGAIELGRYWWTQNTIERAAQKAARYAVVRGDGWTATCAGAVTFRCRASGAQVEDEAEAHLALAPAGPWTVAATCSGGGCIGGPGTIVTVDISGTFDFILWPAPSKALNASSTMVVVR